jgi:transposase
MGMGGQMLERIGIMRFEELLERWQGASLSHGEAAAALGVSERTFRRWRGRYEEAAADGLVDRRVGQPSPQRAPEGELRRMQALYQERYQDFTVKHCHEKLVERHGYELGYTTTLLYLQKPGAVQPASRRGAHRRKRPRRPLRGMMLHQARPRAGGAGPVGCLEACRARRPAGARSGDHPLQPPIGDDATSAIYSAFLVEEEGTCSSFRGLVETIERHGLFPRLHWELYTDRGSHYFFTPEAGGKVSKTQPTQVGRALKQLGHRSLLAASSRALRARLPHPPGPPAQGAGAGRDHHHRGRQRVPA